MRKRLLLLLVMTALTTLGLGAQSKGFDAMRKDFPGLMALYGDRIAGQKAHYIFVVDVSSSMLPYEATVKQNFLRFLDAVPDSDQVSLIRMSDEQHTGFVGLLKRTPLSPATRSSIKAVVNGFHFNRKGSPDDGSDGFGMTKNIIEAINTVGSNDLTFVYMLTDFEYWTHKYKYDKTRENWASLKQLIPKSKMDGMCKYGIELNADSPLRQDAIFKNELDDVLGHVEYQSVSSASLLANWFSHIAASVMSVKLNSLLKSDWRAVTRQLKTTIKTSGNDVSYHIDGEGSPLISGAKVQLTSDNACFVPTAATAPFPGSVCVGHLRQPTDQKSLLPSTIQLGGGKYQATIELQSPYTDEISRLQGVCGEVAGKGDAISLSITDEGTLPSARVWNALWPVWLWIVIVVVLLVIATSFLYEYFMLKLDREWSVSVKAIATDGTTARYNGDGLKAPFTFGPADSALTVKGAPWIIRIYTLRYNPLLFWLKSGYYLELQRGSFADVETEYDEEPRTISAGESIPLCGPGRSTVASIRIKERGHTDYKISID